MLEQKKNLQAIAFMIVQLILIIILCLIPEDSVFLSSTLLILFAIVLLINSKISILSKNWSKYRTYNFTILVVSIVFIPVYAAYNKNDILLIGIIIILANIIAIILALKELFILHKNKLHKEKRKDARIVKKPIEQLIEKSTKKVKISKKAKKEIKKIVAIKGGSKFHSLDCKMVENKSKKRLVYYESAHDAEQAGLKPCKLCKAVNYLHQL